MNLAERGCVNDPRELSSEPLGADDLRHSKGPKESTKI